MQWVSVVCVALCVVGGVWPLPHRGRREAGGEAASSYFYFSRTPGHSFPAVDTAETPSAFFPAKVLASVSEFGGVGVNDGSSAGGLPEHWEPSGGKRFPAVTSDEADDHEAYRVVEEGDDGEGGEHEGGSAAEQEHHGREGGRTGHGYDTRHTAEKAAMGSHGKEAHAHRYAQDGSSKRAHHDAGSHYRDQHREAKRTKGGKHHEKKHHRKGSKTTGYHNVYHKDEYKKEHVFYDTSDHSGQFKKYGSAHEHHADESGRHAHGGHEERAEQEAGYRKAGGKDRGKYDEQHGECKHRHGEEQHDRAGTHFAQAHAGTGERGYQIIHH